MPRLTKATLKKKKKLEAECLKVSYASLSKKREDGVTSAVAHSHASSTHPDAGTCHDIVDCHMSFSQCNDGASLLLDGPKNHHHPWVPMIQLIAHLLLRKHRIQHPSVT